MKKIVLVSCLVLFTMTTTVSARSSVPDVEGATILVNEMLFKGFGSQINPSLSHFTPAAKKALLEVVLEKPYHGDQEIFLWIRHGWGSDIS